MVWAKRLAAPLLVAAAALVLTPAAAYTDLDFDKIFSMVAYRKISDDCFGLRASGKWNRQIHDAESFCTNKVMYDMKNKLPNHNTTPRPVVTTTPRYPYSNKDEQVVQFSKSRIKELFIGNLKKNAMFNCTLQRLNVIDKDMDLKSSTLGQQYEDIPGLSSLLRKDIRKGVQGCLSIANCLTLSDDGGLITPLKRAMIYLKCEKKTKAMACIKDELRQKSAMFELAGLEGIETLAGSDKAEDKTAKMLMLMWSHVYDDDSIVSML